MKVLKKIGATVKQLIYDNLNLTVDKFQKRTIKELQLAEALYGNIISELSDELGKYGLADF